MSDILRDAEQARVLAEFFAAAQDYAQKAKEEPQILILMNVDGTMVSCSNTSTEVGVFLADTFSVHAVLRTYDTPVDEEELE